MPRPAAAFTVAAVEFNPELFEFDRNVERACAVIDEAASHGARLIVMPECALSGYIYRDLEQFLPYMDTVPGVGTAAIEALTRKHGCYVAIGIAEVDRATGLTYNTAALVGPDGYIGKYRKNGLNPSDIAWFTPGNTGYPVFDTELGGLCMIICYDDTYWEPARLPAIKGADLIAYVCASDRVVNDLLDGHAAGAHSTIAAVEQLSAWNGLAMVAADRNNTETNPTTGITVTYGGAASIWQATGERIAHAPATDVNNTPDNPGRILYAQIDPALYDNDQKATLRRRRPELYRDLAFYKAPTDPLASARGCDVQAVVVQYRIVPGDEAGNTERALAVVATIPDSASGRLVVLPAYTFTGVPVDEESARSCAESANGRTVQLLAEIAVRLRAHVVGSHVESSPDGLAHSVVLVSPKGTIVGTYRQTHVSPLAAWCRPGDNLPVFDTEIGRIGLLACDDVRFPEASGVLAVRRADLIAVPSTWSGEYSGWLHDAGGLFAHRYPVNTNALWYAVAKTTQAYTIVANPVGETYQGSSGVFTINPVDSDEPPAVAPIDSECATALQVTTLGRPDWFMSQQRLVGGRRPDLAVPAMLPIDSAAFTRWRDAPGYDITGWSAY